ncbi:MAG TPA: hypothetical protein VE403_03085, partial [Sphingomicrobium sp.]|nr:hypothetical protein [Sphingomicrobium sp.]
MKHARTVAGLSAAGAILLLTAASRPAALAQTSPGLWEISGLPNAGTSVRQCLADTAALARVEHRGLSCKQAVIRDTPRSTEIHYTCTNGDFGQSKLTLVTPRALRIETQGISARYPFNYVVQA